MDDLNKKILDTMKQDTQTQHFSEEEANAWQLIVQSFKGTFRLTFSVLLVIKLLCLGLAVYCCYEMFHASDLGIKVHWAVGTIIAVTGFAIARLWFFMEINRLSVIRELKRVELQVSLLAERLDK